MREYTIFCDKKVIGTVKAESMTKAIEIAKAKWNLKNHYLGVVEK